MKKSIKRAMGVLVWSACLYTSPVIAQMTSVGIDCSQINALDLLKQVNLRAGAALVECGIMQGGRPTGGSDNEAPAPPNILVSNRYCSSPSTCTQSENHGLGKRADRRRELQRC